MDVPTSEVGYTSAMPRREDHEVHKDMWGIGKEEKILSPMATVRATCCNIQKLFFFAHEVRLCAYYKCHSKYRQHWPAGVFTFSLNQMNISAQRLIVLEMLHFLNILPFDASSLKDGLVSAS